MNDSWMAEGAALFRPTFLFLLLVCQSALALDDPFPRVAAAYLVQANGRPLWEKAGAQRLPPASLTKLMTALLVTESAAANDVVTVSRQAARETGTRLGVRFGERFRVEDLLGAALLDSDNDACHALAEHIGGTQARFVERMNRRAAQLGMRNSHFANACGHDAGNHYSTAQDLALLAGEILKNPRIANLAEKDTMEIASVDGTRRFKLENKNALIGRYPGTLGLKTGFTPKAGKCLIAYVRRNDKSVLLVMLNAPNRWWDASDILDLAFAHERGGA
jgi:D-alanyl-D-alanine carboxypeptidase (penicillin-binding protein 5/6)